MGTVELLAKFLAVDGDFSVRSVAATWFQCLGEGCRAMTVILCGRWHDFGRAVSFSLVLRELQDAGRGAFVATGRDA